MMEPTVIINVSFHNSTATQNYQDNSPYAMTWFQLFMLECRRYYATSYNENLSEGDSFKMCSQGKTVRVQEKQVKEEKGTEQG